MFHFMETTRQRNPHAFKEWAIINSGATYGTTISGANKFNVYFGICSSKTAMNNLLQPLGEYDAVLEKAKLNLAAEEDGIALFDNAQKAMPYKHQQDTNSSKYVCVTSRAFAKIYRSENLTSIDNENCHNIKITYIDQDIAIPCDFPEFTDGDILQNIKQLPCGIKETNINS